MRKVKFKKWIPKQILNADNNYEIIVGTNCWEKEFINEGVFHQWGLEIEESENGIVSYSVALIEDEFGVVHSVIPSKMFFIE